MLLLGTVIDTSALLENPTVIDQFDDVVILSNVLRELEKHKSSTKDRGLSARAREVVRVIKRRHKENKIKFDGTNYFCELGEEYDPNYEDNKIISACIKKKYKLITEDYLMQLTAEMFDIEVIDIQSMHSTDDNYKGVIEVEMFEYELNNMYQDLTDNKYDLLLNQYMVVVDKKTGEEIDCLKWDGTSLINISSKGFTTKQFGKFKPYDFYQKSVLDSIQSNEITCVKGSAGTGKSLISLHASWNMIEKGKADKLVIFTNPVKTKDAEALGFYKGTRTEKLLDSQIGIMLKAKFGDMMAIENEIHRGTLELLPLSDIRGYDTSGDQKVIIYLPEGQNTNTELMKLSIQRGGDNARMIVDGDPHTQVDMESYKFNNGMKRMSEVFRGESIYGEVTLKTIYRSEKAKIAEKM